MNTSYADTASGSQSAPVVWSSITNGLDADDLTDDDVQQHRLQPVSFCDARHVERIEGPNQVAQAWRMKERMKTVSVALVLCLNVGVDPPDVVKTSPCARTECWIDPQSTSPQKALETIGNNLQKQYERWQPRARYKQSLDPTLDEVKKLCTSLRRNAKEERVLFHYNGHGVPKPTVNGEIWVFNKTYTQYIPLSVYDLQTWMLSPSIYVYDCSNAGVILDSFRTFQLQREQEIELASRARDRNNGQVNVPVSVKNCIQLAACSVNELLPMNAELPADLFTSCLTTPIKIALRWYVLQHQDRLIPGITLEYIDKIPGQLNDRRTMLGELNWIFTAITDTIAWNTLSRDLFQKLFRQDLLVASLFRNFLLAERIMRSYNCTPTSCPKLPPTYQHPMWQAWDLTLDLCLAQLPDILNNGAVFQHSPFFAEQLTAFQVWVSYGSELRNPPEQLPIVLQVLLSQVHRLRALDLLGRFLDLGPWAVSLALSVGIFPYVLKLLQSSARELRALLVFIWAKILAVDKTCQTDLVKDGGHKYFLSVLNDPYMPSDRKTMAAFVLAMIVNDYQSGQEVALQGNLISKCLEQLQDPDPKLRQWLALALGKVWTNYDDARWCGVRDTAHEKLNDLLVDPVPEVRAAATFALGTFVNNSVERGDHANTIDHGVGMNLLVCLQDGSPLVRQELIVAIAGLIAQFETQFAAVAHHCLDEERQNEQNNPVVGAIAPGWWSVVTNANAAPTALPNQSTFVNSGMKRSSSRGSLKTSVTNSSSFESSGSGEFLPVFERLSMKRVSSASSISGMASGYGSIYQTVWRSLLQLILDPHPQVSKMATSLVNSVKLKVTLALPKPLSPTAFNSSISAPSSPSNKPGITITMGESPKEEKKSRTLPRDGQLEFNPEARRASLNILANRPNLAVAAPQRRLSSDPRYLGESSTDPNLGFGVQYSSQFTRYRKMFDKGPNLVDERDELDVMSPTDKQSLPVKTDFFNWCCRQFAKPVMQMSDEEDRQSSINLASEYRYKRNSVMRHKAVLEQQRAGFSRLDEQIFINRNQAPPTVVKFHPYEPKLAVADRDGVSIWDWDSGPKPEYFTNNNRINSRITSLEFLNAHDKALLLTGADDGSVRVWKDYGIPGIQPELVTAWQGLVDMLPSTRGSGLITNWSQQTSTLLVSGDVRTIRIWDVQKEMKIDDILTGADSCVTSLITDENSGAGCLLIAGCGDGSVRLFDRRLPHHECRVMTLREHQSWVVNVALEHSSAGEHTNRIISASVSGDIRFWDPRFTESVRKIQTNLPGMRCFNVHPMADVLACGYTSQCISVYNQSGDNLSTIKYHDGFMGQRIGPINTMAFHPYFVKLAAGSTDSFISIYSTSRDRRR